MKCVGEFRTTFRTIPRLLEAGAKLQTTYCAGVVAGVSVNVWNAKRRITEYNLLVREDSRDRRGLSVVH